jgi:hypothetical protein
VEAMGTDVWSIFGNYTITKVSTVYKFSHELWWHDAYFEVDVARLLSAET